MIADSAIAKWDTPVSFASIQMRSLAPDTASPKRTEAVSVQKVTLAPVVSSQTQNGVMVVVLRAMMGNAIAKPNTLASDVNTSSLKFASVQVAWRTLATASAMKATLAKAARNVRHTISAFRTVSVATMKRLVAATAHAPKREGALAMKTHSVRHLSAPTVNTPTTAANAATQAGFKKMVHASVQSRVTMLVNAANITPGRHAMARAGRKTTALVTVLKS